MSNLRPADAEAERGLTGQEARNSDRVEPRGEEDSDSVEYPEDEAESGEEADDSDEQELGPHPHDDGQHPAHAHAPHPTQPGNGNDWRMQKESATSQDQSALLPRPDANPREETHLATSGDPNRSLDRPDKAVEHVEPDRDPDDADDFEDEGGRRQVVDDNKLKPAVAEKPPLVSGVDPPADKYAEHAVDLPLEKPHPDTAMDPPDLVSQEGPASGSTKKVPGRDEAKLQPTVEEQQQKEKEAPKSAPQKPSFLERLSGFFVGKKAAPQKNPDMPALEPLAEDAIAAAGEAKREGPSKPAAAHVRGGEILEQPTPGTAAARELPREAKGEGPSKPGAAEVRDAEIMEQPAPGTAAARELPQQTHQVGAKEITGHDSHAGEPPLVSGVDPPADKYAERAVDLPLEKPHPDTAMDPPDLVSQEGPASGSTKKVPGRDEAKLQPTVEEQQQKEKEAPKSAPQKPSFLERLSGFFVGKKAPPQKNPDMPALEPLAEDAIAAAGEAKREGPSKPAAAHVRDGEIMEQPAPGTAAARELPREAKGEGPSELASTGGVVHQPHLTQTGGHHPLSPVDEADTKQRDHVLAADTGATPISVALPGLEDLDSVLARMASGSKDLGLALARSYMELQATHLPSALQPSRPQIVLKPSKVEVPSVPLHRSAEPPLQAPRDVPLQELFKGRVRSMQDPEERKTLWSKGLEFDVALVFPNPDFEESQGLGIRKSILSLICGSWHGPDLAKVQRGVHPREAKRLYHDLLRDETASTQDAFLKAFDELRPWIRGRGREEDWPQSTGTPLTPQTQTSQAKMRREAFRCLSHGGSFRRVDLEQKRGGPEAERDCELGYISSAPEVLYQHTLDPSLSGATDLLSLIRNTVVALLARSGLIVELVFSSDFRWIYALISAGESALEELAAKHSYPRALDLECVDPEATEPCDAQYDPLSLVFQRHGCQEVVELLRALRPEERSSEATVPKGSSTPEDSVRDAYCWYLRSRLKGGKSAAIAKKEANAAWGKEDLLQSTFDRLCGSHGPEVVRVSPGSAQVRHFQRLQVQRLDGKWVTSHFSREDRIMLTMAAVTDACDIFKLINDGYVVDVLPCKGSGEQNQEGQACALQLAWRRHMGAAIALPALLGMGAQVAVAWASEDWWAEILLGYACLTSLWFSIALAAWKLCRKRLLLSRGDVPGSDGSFDICCGSGFIRPAESVSRPFGSTRRQFFGSLKRSLITSNIEEQANPIFSCLRHGLIKLICVTLALASMVLAACTCDLLPINDENFNIPQIQYNVSQHVVALIVVLEIWLFNRVFRVLSLTMTRWENHKLRSDFVHAYHLKAVSLQLINSYASLFYIAFYPDSLKMFEVSYTCSYANGWWNHWGNACRMARLNKQLTTILAAFCLKVAFRCVALLLFSPTKKASQSLPERSSDILDLDHVMSAPRFGDPETDLNVVPSCCFSAASEVIIVLGMFLLFLPASPWTGLLTFIFLQLSNLALARSRRGIPWRAGHPFCHSADLLEASDRLAGTAIQAISWLAMLSMAALLVWPAQLGWGRLNAVLLINEGSDLAPWGVSCALLLVCRFLPGRFVQCTPTAASPESVTPRYLQYKTGAAHR